MYSLTRSTPPTEQPVTLEEAKKQVEVATAIHYHDEQLQRMIKAATEQVERQAGRQILTATYTFRADHFPGNGGRLRLPRPPLLTVASITYLDTDGTSQTLATSVYKVLTAQEPGEIALKYGQVWPAVYAEAEAVTVTYTAGYAATAAALSDSEEWIKHAVLLLVQGYWLREMGQVYDRHMAAAAAVIEGYRCGDDFVEYTP